MNLNKSAMLKAAGVGILLSIVVSVILGLIGAAAVPDGTTVTNPGTQGALAGTSIVSLIVSLALMLVIGALYGYFARREGTPVDVGNYAVGGGLTQLVLTVIMLVVAVIIGLIGLSVPGIDVPNNANAGAIAGVLTAAALVDLVISMIVGAIGGAIYAAMHRNVATTNTTAY